MHRRRLIEPYEISENYFWSTISLATGRSNSVDLYATGVDNCYLNVAIQKAPLTENTFQDTVKHINKFYKTHHLPWVWIIRHGMIPPQLIESPSMKLLDRSTAMYYDVRTLSDTISSHELHILENNQDLTDWGICLCKTYQSPLESTSQYLEVVKLYIEAHKRPTWNRANFHHFVGYLNKIPVSTAILSIHGNKARIDDVGTIPAYQKKGYATQMILHALKESKELGADICFLESSQTGKKVYEKLGFKELFSNMCFQIIDPNS